MIAIVSVFVLLVLSAGSLVILARLYGALEKRHPSVYEAMGRPSVLSPEQEDPYQKALFTFIYKRQYRELNDPVINRISSFLFWYWPSFMGVAAILAVANFVALVQDAT